MAMMKHREPNQVKWQGVRPGHNGEQVLEEDFVNAAGARLIYTVPVGKTLFLTYAHLSITNNILCSVQMYINDTTPVLWHYIGGDYGINNQDLAYYTSSFWPPIEVPAGYTIYRTASFAVTVLAVIHGWVE